ncbi:uncharacterized protein LOC109282416 [Alligator mississippiensis]|uniref:uncharacterized protein LOC109282416 n=1 Tax=Alligator mississippiensis TaxID=8496 RepID=UPI002877D653|nr:uncharacterized protein LOC109282416 [Alligator mississippiensis]
MGSGSSREENSATPLGCMLRNFSKYKGEYGVKMTKDDLIKFCQLEWPTFGVGWPETGSFDVKVANAVLKVVTGDGHWDQYPYIDFWVTAIMTPIAPWVQRCKEEMCKILLAKDTRKKPQVLADSGSEGDLTQGSRRRDRPQPPANNQASREESPESSLASSQSTSSSPGGTASSSLGPESSANSPGTSQSDPNTLRREREGSPKILMATAPPAYKPREKDRPQDPVLDPDPDWPWPSADWPLLLTWCPEYGDGWALAPPPPPPLPPLLPPRRSISSTRNQNPQYRYQCPMRQVAVQGEEPTFVYVPFHTSDLFNWKNQNPSFREDPEKMQSLFRSIGQTHRPTWADVQMMLHTLLTSEERRLVLGAADRIAEGQVGQGGDMRNICPIESPDWDNNSPEGRERNSRYLGIIVEALGKAVPRVTNLSKLYEVRQGKDESPSSFLERLYDAFKKFSSFDPEAQENQLMVNMLFIGQAAPDIRKKLQKTEGGPGKPLSELVEIAYKVYGN